MQSFVCSEALWPSVAFVRSNLDMHASPDWRVALPSAIVVASADGPQLCNGGFDVASSGIVPPHSCGSLAPRTNGLRDEDMPKIRLHADRDPSGGCNHRGTRVTRRTECVPKRRRSAGHDREDANRTLGRSTGFVPPESWAVSDDCRGLGRALERPCTVCVYVARSVSQKSGPSRPMGERLSVRVPWRCESGWVRSDVLWVGRSPWGNWRGGGRQVVVTGGCVVNSLPGTVNSQRGANTSKC